MSISRSRARAIHESLFYAMWALIVSTAIAWTADVPSFLVTALSVAVVALGVALLLLPPVPERKTRRRPAAKKSGNRKRKRKGWSF